MPPRRRTGATVEVDANAALEAIRARDSVRPIQQVVDALARVATPGAFATRRTVDADDVSVTVDGVGAIGLPLSAATARRLIAVARPARYGQRERTLLDRRVRDTWEIGGSAVRVAVRGWDALLGQLGRDLGVPAGCRLRAEMHNLLVYEPGQFFATHQDSEKGDGMVGSMVVLLPSAARGGALEIAHHGERVSFRGDAARVTLVGFYADCRHEVRPVTAGYRAALTFNLFVDGAPANAGSAPATVDALAAVVRAHFDTMRPPRSYGLPPGPPERLLYLLDHEYTQHGLAWDRLKNGDAGRAALLRTVAERLDCEVVLVLADVHECWGCEDDWASGGSAYRWGRRRGRGFAPDPPATARDAPFELTELYETTFALHHPVGVPGARGQLASAEVASDEVASTRPSDEFEPYALEHEGYTGNAGNTVDRWYHRAGVLLWPRARAFALRARAAPGPALAAIARGLARGATADAGAKVRQILPFWKAVVPAPPSAALVRNVLAVAAGIDDADAAAALVEPLPLDCLDPRTARPLGALIGVYGLTWFDARFAHWLRDRHDLAADARRAWLAALPGFMTSLGESAGVNVHPSARMIATAQWGWLERDLAAVLAASNARGAAQVMARAAPAIHGLLTTAARVGHAALVATIVARLGVSPGSPFDGALAVLGLEAAAPTPGLDLGALRDAWDAELAARAARPARRAGDFTIAAVLPCACPLCQRLGGFLAAAGQLGMEWPLAKDGREHVHRTIDRLELPISHVTRQVGSPHRLVLTKRSDLAARDAVEREATIRALAALRALGGRATVGASGMRHRRAAKPARRGRS